MINRRWLFGLFSVPFIPKRVMAHAVGVDTTKWQVIDRPSGVGITFNSDVCKEWRTTYVHNGQKVTEVVLTWKEPLA